MAIRVHRMTLPSRTWFRLFCNISFVVVGWCWSNHPTLLNQHLQRTRVHLSRSEQVGEYHNEDHLSRRSLLWHVVGNSAVAAACFSSFGAPAIAATSTADAQVTDRIFVEIKGLSSANSAAEPPTTSRIVIGLFGNDAPQPVSMLKQLVSKSGLPAPCKPKETRTLQREQLEANKVYNSCVESQEKGVNYDLSTVWRIVKDERIDVGAVSGKYVAREYPTWEGNNALTHDAPGVVSVRRGNDGGYSFTIFPGGNAENLDQDHIVVGRVVEGMEFVEKLNQTPVVASSKVNYMGLTGGPTTKSAPTRACRYGGPMYCNENKPLQKLSLTNTGVL